ncbi:hypothetical protein EON63_05985 [archaeon]|nr:MAG: hypothetical protein EON63_05985 [archaeon]
MALEEVRNEKAGKLGDKKALRVSSKFPDALSHVYVCLVYMYTRIHAYLIYLTQIYTHAAFRVWQDR